MTGVVSTLKNNKSGVKWLDDITLKDAQNIDTYLKLKYAPRIVNNLGLYLNSDIGTLSDMIYTMNGTSWDRLYTSYTSEYNPIWNVDGSETITEDRNLESTDSGTSTSNRTGTDTIRHTGTDSMRDGGTDTIAHSGDYKTSHTGTDSVKQTGTTSTEHTGSDTVAGNGEQSVTSSGSDVLRKTGTDTHTITGSETTEHSGTDSQDQSTSKSIISDHSNSTKSVYGFESTSPAPSEASVTDHDGSETGNLSDSTTYGHSIEVTKKDTDSDSVDTSDTTTYGKNDTTKHNSTQTTTYDSGTSESVNRSDTTTYGGVDTTTDTRKESTEYGKTSTNTKDLSDATTYGSGEYGSTEGNHKDTGTITTTHKRGGNIGVTMTQQMLQADLDYWAQLEAKFFERVCKDIVDMITYKIYTVTDETSEDVGGVSIDDYVKDIIPTIHEGVKIADVQSVHAERED